MLCYGILLFTVLLHRYLLRRGVRLPPKAVKLTYAAVLFGCLLGTAEWVKNRYHFTPELLRPAYGDGDAEEDVLVLHDEEKTTVTVHVSQRALSDEEAEALFSEAMEEIDRTFPGKNESLEEVRTDVVPKTAYASGAVDAVWSFDGKDLIKSDGSIIFSEVKAPVILYATATLSVEEHTKVYTFPLRLWPKDIRTDDGFSYYLSESLASADQEDPLGAAVKLPDTVEEVPVSWQGADSMMGPEVALLGLLGGAAMVFGEREEKRRERKQREAALMRDYPDLVSQLSLYVGAGLPVKAAFQRIAEGYLSRRALTGPRPGYECIVRTVRSMQDGVGEQQAYRDFGEAAAHKNYRKLSMLLSQNLKKGTENLITLLENEEREAFELRKANAKVRGEEASTKLLLPMMGLLLMMLVIMVVPALMGVGI